MNYEEWSPWVNITIVCPWVNLRYFIIIIIIIIVVVNIIKIKRLIRVVLYWAEGMKSLGQLNRFCFYCLLLLVINIIIIQQLITVCLILDELWGMKVPWSTLEYYVPGSTQDISLLLLLLTLLTLLK